MPRITGEILHYRRDRLRTLRVPWRLNDLHAKGMRLQTDRIQHGQQALDAADLADALGVTPQRWQQACIAHRHRHLVSLQAPKQATVTKPPSSQHTSRVTPSPVNPSQRPSAVMAENSFKKPGPCAQTLALCALDRRTVHHGDRTPRWHRSTHAATPPKTTASATCGGKRSRLRAKTKRPCHKHGQACSPGRLQTIDELIAEPGPTALANSTQKGSRAGWQ